MAFPQPAHMEYTFPLGGDSCPLFPVVVVVAVVVVAADGGGIAGGGASGGCRRCG